MPHLNPQAPEEKRNSYCQQAVAVRESNPAESIQMFKEIIRWDKTHDKDPSDTWGHLYTAYKLSAQLAKTDQERTRFRQQARAAAAKAVELAKISRDQAREAVAKTHLSTELMEAGRLEEALRVIEEALSNFPGSKAHLAWPGNHRVQLLWKLGRRSEAWEALAEYEEALAEGYSEELKEVDGRRKLQVWWAGLMLTRARMFFDEGCTLLGQLTVNAVLRQPDPDSFLVARKNQARKLLEEASPPKPGTP